MFIEAKVTSLLTMSFQAWDSLFTEIILNTSPIIKGLCGLLQIDFLLNKIRTVTVYMVILRGHKFCTFVVHETFIRVHCLGKSGP